MVEGSYTSAVREFAGGGSSECSANEGSRGYMGDWPRRAAGGCDGCFAFGICEIVARDSFER